MTESRSDPAERNWGSQLAVAGPTGIPSYESKTAHDGMGHYLQGGLYRVLGGKTEIPERGAKKSSKAGNGGQG